MEPTGSFFSEEFAARFVIARETGAILDTDGSTESLLGYAASELTGMSWWQALGVERAGDDPLTLALESASRAQLPPTIIADRQGLEILVDGLVQPAAQADSLELSLHRLADAGNHPLAGERLESSVTAVLAVDQLVLGEEWGVAELDQLVWDIRSSLMGIARKGDWVSEPRGRFIILVLREVSIEEAGDICRAMLSHVNSMPLSSGGVARPRICLGLAQAEDKKSALRLLLQAHDALLRAQLADSGERIRVATPDDRGWVAACSLGVANLFTPVANRRDDAAVEEPSEEALREAREQRRPEVRAIETGIEGYVDDNMEGAIDQAVFLARLDMPVAILGPQGTGKLYVARIIHQESGGAPEMLVPIDCREFRSRKSAMMRITRELEGSEGKTLVFKSPQLMHEDVQVKLARQISTRTLADATPPRYLPQAKYIALFPDNLERMVRHGGLTEKLASVFAGFPIHVPPIRDRKQAVLRWAHKILGQESAQQDRLVLGFTPDAEQAMLQYDWPGNISEMRQCIVTALAQTDKEWLTPVDLGIFKGISADGAPGAEVSKPFLEVMDADTEEDEEYAPAVEDQLSVALGEAVHSLLEVDAIKPLGSWLEDEVVLAACDRYRGDMPAAATFLHTRSRNISRWMPKIEQRDGERTASLVWQEPRRLVREWIRSTPQLEEAPLSLAQGMLLRHIIKQARGISVADRARLLGVSTPTYQKRLQQVEAG